jgi:hypothetical protein
MKSNAPLVRSARVVVLNANPLEHLCGSVIHPNRNGDVVFAERHSQELAGAAVEAEPIGDAIELRLRLSQGGESVAIGGLSIQRVQ